MAVPLSARRGKIHLHLKTDGIVGKAVIKDSFGDRLRVSSIKQCGAERFGSSSSVESSCISEWDSKEEACLKARPICQMGYDVHEVLGSGSVAVAYRVRRRSDGQDFAAKCAKGTDEQVRSTIVGEHNLMKELVHDNILKAKELLDFRTEIWLCTELCIEGTVDSYVRLHGAFSEGHCRILARQLVDGVQYLHCRRVVHTDIKPENLFLGNGAFQLKIGDFNSAKKIGITADQHTAVWMLSIRGTPLYSAPELRFNRVWNERVDIWNIGLSVYFMARAASPFNVGNPRVVGALREGQLPQISWQGMSTAMAHLVRHCLAVDMRDRPTAMELLWHPAFEEVPGHQANGSTTTRRCCPSGSNSTAWSSCGLLFSCTAFQAPRSGIEGNWQRTALRNLALEILPTLESLPSFGVIRPWAV